MNKNVIINNLSTIISTYGNTELSFSKINTELGIEYAKLLKTYGENTSSNIYSLPDLDILIERVNLLNVDNNSIDDSNKQENDKITTFHKIDNLIPSINPKYVPFGCYNTILRIVSNESFLPAYITGESGNGKCFFKDHKIKIRVSEDDYKKYFLKK